MDQRSADALVLIFAKYAWFVHVNTYGIRWHIYVYEHVYMLESARHPFRD